MADRCVVGGCREARDSVGFLCRSHWHEWVRSPESLTSRSKLEEGNEHAARTAFMDWVRTTEAIERGRKR